MKELIKVFNGSVLPIEVINEKEFMIDVSGIAKAHGKILVIGKKLNVLKS